MSSLVSFLILEESFKTSPLNMMLPVYLSHMDLIILRHIPSIPHLLRVFIINKC